MQPIFVLPSAIMLTAVFVALLSSVLSGEIYWKDAWQHAFLMLVLSISFSNCRRRPYPFFLIFEYMTYTYFISAGAFAYTDVELPNVLFTVDGRQQLNVVGEKFSYAITHPIVAINAISSDIDTLFFLFSLFSIYAIRTYFLMRERSG